MDMGAKRHVLSEQLWSLVVPQPWCAALRAVAQTLPEYNVNMPVK